jgi:hypothetical protein
LPLTPGKLQPAFAHAGREPLRKLRKQVGEPSGLRRSADARLIGLVGCKRDIL